MGLLIYCADIGSVARGNFGWARLTSDNAKACCSTGNDIRLFADSIAADLNVGHRVALGFECPLFVPVPDNPERLTSARPNEHPPWSAGPGPAALATGLTETVWILDRVRQQLTAPNAVHFKWESFQTRGGLFVWEAFVTGAAKADTHHGDAELAVLSFRDSLPDPERQNAIIAEGRVRSLIGAAVLQTGWASELAWLAEPCLVIRVQPKTGR